MVFWFSDRQERWSGSDRHGYLINMTADQPPSENGLAWGGVSGDRFLITVLVDQKIKIPAWYCLEDEAVMLFDSYFTFESKLGWHRLFLTVESTRGIRTLAVVFKLLEEMVAWIPIHPRGMVSLTNNFRFCRLNWKYSSFELLSFVFLTVLDLPAWFISAIYASCWQVPKNGG